MQKRFLIRLRGLVAGALLSAVSLVSAPIAIDSSSTVTIDFNGFYDVSQILIPGLSAQVILSNFAFSSTTIDSQAATQVSFDYLLNNTSGDPVLTSRVSNFAFNTDPNILNTILNQVTGVFNTVEIGQSQPNGIGTVEICFTAASCPGGGSDGVSMGSSGGGSAILHFAGSLTSFSLDNSYVRYQSIACSEGSPCNASANGVPTGPPSDDPGIPEPSTNILMSLGIAGLALASRRFTRRG